MQTTSKFPQEMEANLFQHVKEIVAATGLLNSAEKQLNWIRFHPPVPVNSAGCQADHEWFFPKNEVFG